MYIWQILESNGLLLDCMSVFVCLFVCLFATTFLCVFVRVFSQMGNGQFDRNSAEILGKWAICLPCVSVAQLFHETYSRKTCNNILFNNNSSRSLLMSYDCQS